MSSVILQSVSSMIVPSRLVLSGISYSQSIGLYGIISGMVMPFVYLPFTIGSALVVNLIPSISQEVALNKIKSVKIKINNEIIILLDLINFLNSQFIIFLPQKSFIVMSMSVY